MSPPVPHWRRTWRWAVLSGCVTGLALALAAETGHVLVGSNFHAVVPGQVYRCSQQTGPEWERILHAYGIRTVINLRGNGFPSPWYVDECRVTHRLDVCQEDICFSASRLPSAHELRRFVEVLDHTEYPIVLHCRRGADRTGVGSAIVRLLQPDGTLEQARHQLSPRYGHVAMGRVANLDLFLELYADWLGINHLAHSPPVFRQWLDHGYCEGAYCCRLQALDVPTRLRPGEPTAWRVRAHNVGTRTWHFCSGTTAGIHIAPILMNEQEVWLPTNRTGLFDADVEPGESIDLTVVLPPLMAGPYHVVVDLVDEQQCWFYQVGSEPLERDVEVGERP